MANHDDRIQLISECDIKPKHKVEKSEQPHYLSPDDLMMLSLHYMQKGLLFAKPTTFDSTDLESFLKELKHSLSLALVHFYPLAGQFVTKKYEHENCCWIYGDCNKGPGARFIHAKADLKLHDVISSSSDVAHVTRSFFELGERSIVNHDGHTRALLSVQVTDLVDGLFIGFTMNHSVADGTSLWHFVSTLSEIFNNPKLDRISRVPVFRSSFLEGYDPVIKLPYSSPDQFITRVDISPELRERIFHFSATSVAVLKAKANTDSKCLDRGKISSFQALSALLWISITRARKLLLDAETTCSLIVNSRTRFDPPFSQDCFGNFGLVAQGTSKVGELLGNGIGWAATLLHQGVAAQDDRAANALKACIGAPFIGQPGWDVSFFGSNPIVIGGSVRFDMYGPEFGLGRATAVLAGSANKLDGKVTANPGCDGEGSADLEVCLNAEIMSNLELDDEFMNFVS